MQMTNCDRPEAYPSRGGFLLGDYLMASTGVQGAGHRAMMDEARSDLAKAREDGLSEAESITAELGQISNMGPE
jgi:hypothetical protein